MIPGVAIFGGAYVLALLMGMGGRFQSNSGWLVVPIVGPLITAAKVSDNVCVEGSTYCSGSSDGPTILLLDGLAQAAGVALFVWGMQGTKVLIRSDFASMVVTPAAVGASGYGAAVRGLF